MDALIIIRNIAEIIFIVLFIIFILYAFKALKKISASVENIEDSVLKTYRDLTPVLSDVSAAAGDIREISGKSRQLYFKAESAVNTLVEKVNDVSDVIGFAGNKAKSAVNESTNLITAVSKGVRAFRNKLTQ